MADLITQTGTVLTGLLGWSGDIITFIMAKPILLIPTIIGLASIAIGVTRRLMP